MSFLTRRRKIAESVTGGKDRSTETERFIDYLRKRGTSESDIQKYIRAQLPGTPEYDDVQKKKFKNYITFRSDAMRDAANGDPDAIDAVNFMKATEAELSAARVKEAEEKARKTAPFKPAAGAASDALTPEQSRKAEIEPLQIELKEKQDALKKLKSQNLVRKGITGKYGPDLAGECRPVLDGAVGVGVTRRAGRQLLQGGGQDADFHEARPEGRCGHGVP